MYIISMMMVQWTALDVVYRSYFTICQYSFRAILHGPYMWPLQDGIKTLSMAIFSNHWKVLCELSKSLEVVAISSSMFGSHWKLGWYRCKNLMHFTYTVSLWGWSVFLSNHIHTCKDINNSKNNSNNTIDWHFLSVFKFAQTSRTVQLFYL